MLEQQLGLGKVNGLVHEIDCRLIKVSALVMLLMMIMTTRVTGKKTGSTQLTLYMPFACSQLVSVKRDILLILKVYNYYSILQLPSLVHS
jgi:hypothetical protein